MAGEIKFPEGFLWGAATSAYQVEGGIENNDWASYAKASEGQGQPKIPFAGRACDHYNRYEEDFDIAKLLSQNAHRLSIEWSRVEPEEGKFDEAEIEHYRKVLKALRERGIKPFVTLWHWTLPLWFAKRGHWLAKDSPQVFARYCQYVVAKLGDLANFWITINEPLVYASGGFLKGKWPPFLKNPFKFHKVVHKLVMSHNIAYRGLKKINPNLKIGIAKHNIDFEANWNPIYKLTAFFMNWFWNFRFLNKIKRCQDFIGLNFYFHKKFGDNQKYEKNDMGWDIYPKGIYDVLLELKRYRKPVYITENGIADAADTKRAKYIKNHLRWVWRAIHDGCDVRSYFYWSLLDNFEWAHGFSPRFGLVEVDYKTMERRIRPSAYEYKKICENNSLGSPLNPKP